MVFLLNCDSKKNNKVSYGFDVKPIFDVNCISCHGSGEYSNANLDLSTYESIIYDTSDNGPVIIPKYPERSILIDKILNNQPAIGSRMPYEGLPLDYDDIRTVEVWIYYGAKDN